MAIERPCGVGRILIQCFDDEICIENGIVEYQYLRSHDNDIASVRDRGGIVPGLPLIRGMIEVRDEIPGRFVPCDRQEYFIPVPIDVLPRIGHPY